MGKFADNGVSIRVAGALRPDRSILPFPESSIHTSLSFHLSPLRSLHLLSSCYALKIPEGAVVRGIEREGAAVLGGRWVLESQHLDASTHPPRGLILSRPGMLTFKEHFTR